MRVLVIGSVVLLAACNANQTVKLENSLPDEKVSYGIGYRVGMDMRHSEIDPDRNILLQGIEDALDGKSPRYTPQAIQAAITEYRQQREDARLKLAEANEAAGLKFLTEYKKQADVIETPSGIQYRVLIAGTGKQPGLDDTVSVQYLGRLINGKQFDTTHQHDKSTILRVAQTIPGWQEVLPLMQEGAKWEVVIPARLAYDLRGVPPTIGPKETLVFELTLVGIVSLAEPASNARVTD